MKVFTKAAADANAHGVEFMQVEISLANTFLNLANTSRRQASQAQGRHDATTAYRFVLHFLPKLRLTVEQSLEFAIEMDILRDRLLAAGVTV